ncbi:MAG TPA: PSD1 and planctomycete cytochrome C domain-containing protein [Chthoniobacteraceae bacterium]|jgi:hypothetical protein|nr:PSD1 and planctomycete cytochrome C domain-containing protein [Chthoniobacteraceae bacterium]
MTAPSPTIPRLCAALATLLLLAPAGRAEPDYAKEIKPLLKSRCYACHGALKQKAGLRLDAVSLMHKGGESGDVIEKGSALLLEKVASTDKDERMPPEGAPLTPEEVAKLKAWIVAGAVAPADDKAEPDPRLHWAYQVPKAAAAGAAKSPQAAIDLLMDARLQARGLQAQQEAAPEVWLRRVYLDLTGLPPSADEVRQFLSDFAAEPRAAEGEAPSIMARTVDRLLATPAYGERWARHFMDIWRYTDGYGLGEQLRYAQRHMWHWRDWIIESLNADKGYDRMIVEMLAADEAAPEDRDALRATGFLCRNYFLFNRTTWLDETIEHTSRAFLGVTMQCTKCHDHKYDPVTQVDYYRMRAVFEPYHVRLDPAPGEPDFARDGIPRVFDLHLDKATYVHKRGDEKNEDKTRPLTPGVPEVLAFADFKPQPVSLPATAREPALLPSVLEDQLRAAEKEIAQAKTARQQAEAKLDDLLRDEVESAQALEQAQAAVAFSEKAILAAEAKPAMLRATLAADRLRLTEPKSPACATDAAAAAKADALYQLAKAESDLAKARVDAFNPATAKVPDPAKKIPAAEQAVVAARKKLEAPGDKYTAIRASLKAQEGPEDSKNAEVQTYPETSTGRRLALAQWIANERNPLTARVLVNHLWLRHFGASLVPDVTDFGRRCQPPLHQDVLDTLAAGFMQHGWSMKYLHRAMVLSQLYRRSSSNAGATEETLAADPDNTCYWRMNPRRLESQAVRDSMLQAAGLLDLHVGGPSVNPDEAGVRRSLYFVQTADVEHRLLAAFDNSNVLECYRRQESIVPQQALALANGRLTRQCADALVARSASKPDAEFIDEAFLSLLGRAPTPEESAACLQTMAELRQQKSANARSLVLQALINHNDFITLR